MPGIFSGVDLPSLLRINGSISGDSTPRAYTGQVIGLQEFYIAFTRPVSVDSLTGIEYSIDGGAWTTPTGYADGPVLGLQWSFTTATTIADGVSVAWRYAGGTDSILDIDEAEDIGPQFVPVVVNPIDTTAPTLLAAEVGTQGSNIFTISLSEPIESTGNAYSTGWSISSNLGPYTISAYEYSGGTLLYLVTTEYATSAEILTVSYDSGAGNITDASGFPTKNPLLDVTSQAVTNNVQTGADTEPPTVTLFVCNGGSGTTTSTTITIQTLIAADNVSQPQNMEYLVNTTPATPPSPSDPGWVDFSYRLASITVPSTGTYTITAYVKDEAGNVSRGLSGAQQVVVVELPAPVFAALGYNPSTFELSGVQDGVGTLTNARATVVNILDNTGKFRALQAGATGYPGARFSASSPFTQYADNGSGTLLTPQPYVHRVPASTNIILHSGNVNTIATTEWTKSRQTDQDITDTTAPIGTPRKLVPNSSGDYQRYHAQAINLTGSYYTFSTIVKADGYTWFSLSYNRAILPWCNFELVGAGTIGYNGAVINAFIIPLANGWYNVGFTSNATITNNTGVIQFGPKPANENNRTPAFEGNDVDGCRICLVQVEAGTLVTPPILTTTTTVYRPKDEPVFNIANWDNTEGSCYFEIDAEDATYRVLGHFSDIAKATPNEFILTDGSVGYFTPCPPGEHKIGFVWGSGTWRVNVDGVWATEAPYNGTMPDGVLDLFRDATVIGKMRNLKRWDMKDESVIEGEMA